MTAAAYDSLTHTFTRLYRYQHLSAFLGWDQAAMMPPAGNDARGAAMAELQVLMHHTLANKALPSLMLQAAERTAGCGAEGQPARDAP